MKNIILLTPSYLPMEEVLLAKMHCLAFHDDVPEVIVPQLLFEGLDLNLNKATKMLLDKLPACQIIYGYEDWDDNVMYRTVVAEHFRRKPKVRKFRPVEDLKIKVKATA